MSHVTESIKVIRDELTSTAKQLHPDSNALRWIDPLRAACREYLTAVENRPADSAADFETALAQLRSAFYFAALEAAERYQLEPARGLADEMAASGDMSPLAGAHSMAELSLPIGPIALLDSGERQPSGGRVEHARALPSDDKCEGDVDPPALEALTDSDGRETQPERERFAKNPFLCNAAFYAQAFARIRTSCDTEPYKAVLDAIDLLEVAIRDRVSRELGIDAREIACQQLVGDLHDLQALSDRSVSTYEHLMSMRSSLTHGGKMVSFRAALDVIDHSESLVGLLTP
jgi:hypothetical protein